MENKLQPMYFAARRESGTPGAFCITSVVAQNMFKHKIFMSTDQVDIVILKIDEKTYQTVQQQNGFQIIRDQYKKGFLISSDFDTHTFFEITLSSGAKEYFLIMTTSAAANVRDFPRKNYCAFRISTPGHVSIALWNIPKKICEMFDPSGSTLGSVQATIQLKALEWFFQSTSNYWQSTLPSLVLVNPYNLQSTKMGILPDPKTNPGDNFCQTWIYIYLDMRVNKQMTAKQVIDTLALMPSLQRFTYVHNYWNKLIRSGGINNTNITSLSK